MPVRQRKEVQEMLRSLKNRAVWGAALFTTLAAAVPARPAIWPEQIGEFKRTVSRPLAVSDRALWDEYGLAAAEQAEYVAGDRKFLGDAYQLKDPTGAFGAFEWQRPADARSSKLAEVAAETRNAILLVHGNYLFRLTGWKPPQAVDLEPLFERLSNLDKASLPPLRNYLPDADLVPNSERYLLGPEALAKFHPGVPPSVAAFHLGAEAQLGSYQTKAGPMELAIFSYPTPQIAIQRVTQFQKLPGAMAKRAGPMVAVVLSPPDPDAAERLLAQITYQASITLNERVPTARDNVGDLIVNIFILIGILISLFLVAGLAFGFLRRWVRWGNPEEPIILLHLEDR